MNTENSVRSENTGVPTIREIIVATTMSSLFVAVFALVTASFRTRAALQAEILALRHQLAVFQKNGPRRLRLHRCDRLLWVLLYRFWSGWRRCLEMVQPDTVIRWHRKAFAWYWTGKERRRVLHFGVTEHPTQEWTMQQMREAFPWDQAPRYVLRDRDAIYGRDFAAMIRHMGIEEVLTAPRSPWQNPFVERLVGSIRRECLDHVIVWNDRSLRRTLHNYFAYYQWSRTHLALGKDAPESRAVEPPEQGRVVAIPQVGGLHHRYQRRAA